MKKQSMRILLCLILGLVTTVAVAWGFAIWVDANPLDPALRKEQFGVNVQELPRWETSVINQTATTFVSFSSLTVKRPRGLRDGATGREIADWINRNNLFQQGKPAPVEDLPTLKPPYWSRACVSPIQDEVDTFRGMEDARGWPMRCLVAYIDIKKEPLDRKWSPMIIKWQIEFGDTQGLLGLPRGLPYKPIWFGLLVNILLYSSIFYFFLFGFVQLKRARRRRRGRCPKCNYDLRGDFDPGCPECGWGRE